MISHADKKFYNVDFICLYLAIHGPCRSFRIRRALAIFRGKPNPGRYYCDYFSDDITPCRYAAPNAADIIGPDGMETTKDAQLWQRRRDLDRSIMTTSWGGSPYKKYTTAFWELTPRGIDRSYIAGLKAAHQGIDLGEEL